MTADPYEAGDGEIDKGGNEEKSKHKYENLKTRGKYKINTTAPTKIYYFSLAHWGKKFTIQNWRERRELKREKN